MSRMTTRDAEEIAWELLSYLALDPDAQESMIGRTEEWFCCEIVDVNPGANYLLGMVYAFSSYKNILFDSADLDEKSVIFELDSLLKNMTSDTKNYFWTIEQVNQNPAWQLVRNLSRLVLDEAGLDLNPPAEPFWFPEIFEVEGYPMRGLPTQNRAAD